MYKFKKRIKTISFVSLLSLFTLGVIGSASAGAWKTPLPSEFKTLKSLEYNLRWDNARFRSHYAWHFIPSAKAELPPQYQKAFSLKIKPDHKKKTLHVEFHKQMVTDDQTHRYGSFKTSSKEYQVLANLLKQPVICTSQVDRGWVGPSPEYLSLSYKNSENVLYASESHGGPAGPGQENSENGKRLHLCNTDLKDWLKKQIGNVPLKSK